MATAAATANGTGDRSPFKVAISPGNSGLWKFTQTEEVAKKASDLLQQDLETHHVYFNNEGFHNHIPHHLLALYGTGAGSAELQKAYDENAGYQRPVLRQHERVTADLQRWDHAGKYLGKEQYYPDFLKFFQSQIVEKGSWHDVLTEYALKGGDAADDMLVRLFAGFLHPLIQLMYGMEWDQPAIVAEGLAQAAVHNNDIGGFLLPAEQAASARTDDMPSISSLYQAVAANAKLRTAARMSDSNKVRDGVLKRARDEILAVAGRVKVRPEELEERTAEMFNAAVYVAAAAAVHPGKMPKVDFFLMHHVNAAPIFLTINAQSWIPLETKVRLLEWKIRMDLLQYAARSCPPLSLDKITAHKPADASAATPIDVIKRLHGRIDDGHSIKLGRAAGICQIISKPFESGDRLIIKGDDTWMKVHHLIVDSILNVPGSWVRGAGLDEAWKEIPDAPDAKL